MQHLSEPAILSPEMIVDWKRKRGVYNFTTLPGKAIIGLTHHIFSQQLPFFPKRIKGIAGTHFTHDSYVYCSSFGSGASALVTLMEELRALGVREFIFIGLCASLSENIASGEAFYVERALSANGITSTYVAEKMIVPYDEQYIKSLAEHLNLKGNICVSTDSPFRETPSFIMKAKNEGCNLIEMECAAAYAFSHFYKLKVACLLVVADQMEPIWTAPSDMNLLSKVQQQLVNGIVKSNL
jgi:uridine phosphorylase